MCVVSSLFLSILIVLSASYPIYKGTGSHYENGVAIGTSAKERIQKFVATYPPMQQLRFCLLTGCSAQFRELVEFNQKIWPQYFEELSGIAEGAQVEEMDLQLLSFRLEILAVSNALSSNHQIKSDVLQCSDILLNKQTYQGFGHNEDGWNGTLDTAYYSHYHITNGSGNEFIAFEYPGSIVGHAFGFNQYGLALSMNAVFPQNVTIPARGAFFLSRALLDARNVSHAMDILYDYDEDSAVCSYGTSLNIGYRQEDKQVVIANIEVSNHNISVQYYSQHEGNHAFGYHFNMYLRGNVAQEVDVSSLHRMNRTQEIIANQGLNTMNDVRDVLGDTRDTQYPLYRDSNPPDDSSTLATAMFDMEEQIMYVFEQCNPKTCFPSRNISFAL
eukprot:206886_1